MGGSNSAGTSSTGPERALTLKSSGLKQARKSLDRAAVLDDSDEEVPGSGPSGHQPQPAQLDDAAIQVIKKRLCETEILFIIRSYDKLSYF